MMFPGGDNPINTTSKHMTPLQYVLSEIFTYDGSDMARLLIQYGANPHNVDHQYPFNAIKRTV
jgi:hypothetical protein